MNEALAGAVEPHADGALVRVRAQPGSRRNSLTGMREGELCVAVTAPPDRGRANEALVEVLAKALGVSRSRIELVSGGTNRHKRFVVQGITAEAARAALATGMETAG
jgi:hypothetical protein